MKRYKIQSTESFEKEMRAVAPENGTHPKMQPFRASLQLRR